MDTPQRVEILGSTRSEWSEILTSEALDFIAALARQFEHRRRALLAAREQRWADIKAGALPDFLSETAEIRGSDWKVASIPADFSNRRVEITGPTDRRMVINALNSGAQVFMADFEDANAPTWENMVQGQLNLRDAVRRTITFVSPEGREYRLNDTIATLAVRPRGWHLIEKHVHVDGEPGGRWPARFSISVFISSTMRAN